MVSTTNTKGFLDFITGDRFDKVNGELHFESALIEMDKNLRLLKTRKEKLADFIEGVNSEVSSVQSLLKNYKGASVIDRIELLENFTDSFKSHLNTCVLTMKQKIILLSYLGVLDALNTSVDSDLKRAEMLSYLIEENKQNIRQILPYITSHSITTEKNKEKYLIADLEAVKKLTQNMKLKDISEKINERIIELERKVKPGKKL